MSDNSATGFDEPDTRHSSDQRSTSKMKNRGDLSKQEEKKSPDQETVTMKDFENLHYTCYDKIGKVVIVNNLDMEDRIRKEMENLKRNLQKLGFEAVTVKGNLKPNKGKKDIEFVGIQRDDMISLMRDASLDDYRGYYCFLCIFLGYGRDGVLEFETDKKSSQHEYLEITSVQEFFKDKPSLNMKPKLFFVQAGDWPGEKTDGGDTKEPKTREMKIPREADFFTYLSELSGGDLPKYFLETLTEALDEFVINRIQEPLEINKFAIRMNGILEKKLNVEELRFDESIRIPCVTSLLTKYMHFNRKV